MFGPYAGFSTKFLKTGSLFDLSSRSGRHNSCTMLSVARQPRPGLYLVNEVLRRAPRSWRRCSVRAERQPRRLVPDHRRPARAGHEEGCRQGGVPQFGTEVVASEDGSIAGLLGASPGASTAVPIMLTLIERCFPEQVEAWRPKIAKMIPTYGKTLSEDPALASTLMSSTAKALSIG